MSNIKDTNFTAMSEYWNANITRVIKVKDKYIPVADDQYLNYVTATAGDIASGKTGADEHGYPVFGTYKPSGGGGTGSGVFNLAKVTAFSPYVEAMSGLSQIVVSGLGDDYDSANGTYNVTAETEKESDIFKRIYQHTSGEWYIWGEYEPEYEEGYWYIGVAPDSGDLVYYTSEELTDGEYSFENWDTGDSYDLTLDVTKTEYPATPMVLKGVIATGYENSNGKWSFGTAEQNFAGFEYSPSVGNLYVTSGNALIGMSIDVPDGIMYLRFRIDKVRYSDAGVQFSEFLLFDKDGNPVFLNTLNIAEFSADEKNDSPSEQEPEKAFDGEVSDGNSKWFSWSFNNPSWVQVRFAQPVAIANYPQYGWYTANDTTGRDPVSWSVMVSKNGVAWTPISVVNDYATPTERGVLAGKWEF